MKFSTLQGMHGGKNVLTPLRLNFCRRALRISFHVSHRGFTTHCLWLIFYGNVSALFHIRSVHVLVADGGKEKKSGKLSLLWCGKNSPCRGGGKLTSKTHQKTLHKPNFSRWLSSLIYWFFIKNLLWKVALEWWELLLHFFGARKLSEINVGKFSPTLASYLW